MHSVLDAPVTADHGRQLLGRGVLPGQIGDGVDDLGAGVVTARADLSGGSASFLASGSADPQREFGVWEADPTGEAGDLHGAFLDAPVSGICAAQQR